MLENINLKDFPKSSGVYWFISNNEVVYVGSSKNLYRRMKEHKIRLKKGIGSSRNKDLYQFLQSNQFKVGYHSTNYYRQIEQELIEKHNPKYNSHRAFAGVGAFKGKEVEYQRDYQRKYLKEYHKQYNKQYNEFHKNDIKQKDYKYNHQMCNYNGEILTLGALKKRFIKQGIEHPVIEAKKYLIK